MVEKTDSEAIVREIKRRTRKKYSSEEKIRIVLEGLRGEVGIAELCRKEGIHQNVYYKWSKDFLEAGKKRLQGDTAREATSSGVGDLKKENDQLKALVAELSLKIPGHCGPHKMRMPLVRKRKAFDLDCSHNGLYHSA
jgi:transposase